MQGNDTLSHLTTQAYELLLDRFIKKTSRKPSGCIEWIGTGNGHGYGHLRLPGDKGNKIAKRKAHRISFMLFVGDIPEGLFVLHSCDNRACVKPTHLRCGTQEEIAARDLLEAAMREAGLKHYEYDGKIIDFVATEKIKVKAAKDDDGEEDDDE